MTDLSRASQPLPDRRRRACTCMTFETLFKLTASYSSMWSGMFRLQRLLQCTAVHCSHMQQVHFKTSIIETVQLQTATLQTLVTPYRSTGVLVAVAGTIRVDLLARNSRITVATIIIIAFFAINYATTTCKKL